jgi:hypothetical protein
VAEMGGEGDRGEARDKSGSENTFTSSASMFFCRMWIGVDIARMRLRMQIFSDIGYGAESDRLRSGCRLI